MSTLDFNARNYTPEQPEDEVTNPYHLWVRACQLHNLEIQSAKDAYKNAILDSHVQIALIKQKVEALRVVYKKLELLPKPVQPTEKHNEE